jgi:hypothetical protein
LPYIRDFPTPEFSSAPVWRRRNAPLALVPYRSLRETAQVKMLPPPNSHHLLAAQGWLGFGNHLEAEKELDVLFVQQVLSASRTHVADADRGARLDVRTQVLYDYGKLLLDLKDIISGTIRVTKIYFIGLRDRPRTCEMSRQL